MQVTFLRFFKNTSTFVWCRLVFEHGTCKHEELQSANFDAEYTQFIEMLVKCGTVLAKDTVFRGERMKKMVQCSNTSLHHTNVDVFLKNRKKVTCIRSYPFSHFYKHLN